MADYKIVTYSDRAHGIRKPGILVRITPDAEDPQQGDTDENGVFMIQIVGEQGNWIAAMIDEDFGTNDENPDVVGSPETTLEFEVFPLP